MQADFSTRSCSSGPCPVNCEYIQGQSYHSLSRLHSPGFSHYHCDFFFLPFYPVGMYFAAACCFASFFLFASLRMVDQAKWNHLSQRPRLSIGLPPVFELLIIFFLLILLIQLSPCLIFIAARSYCWLRFSFLLRMTFHVFIPFLICVVIVLKINEEIYFQTLGIEFQVILITLG